MGFADWGVRDLSHCRIEDLITDFFEQLKE